VLLEQTFGKLAIAPNGDFRLVAGTNRNLEQMVENKAVSQEELAMEGNPLHTTNPDNSIRRNNSLIILHP